MLLNTRSWSAIFNALPINTPGKPFILKPKIVGPNKEPVPDVSKGSTGIIDVINTAFVITAMKYLNLLDAPLYLDEFGSSFSVEHREQATAVIKILLEQKAFTQLFVISHYHEGYSALSNADICVLSNLNVTVPNSNNVNKHVSIR